MTNKNKLIKVFLDNPYSLKYHDIELILLDFGFKKRQAKGSHVKFTHSKIKESIIISIHNNNCKGGYKKRIAKFIKYYFL